LTMSSSGMPAIWRESWKNFDSITTLIVCTLRSMAIHHQKSAAKPLSAALTSTNSGGNLIAADYTSYP